MVLAGYQGFNTVPDRRTLSDGLSYLSNYLPVIASLVFSAWRLFFPVVLHSRDREYVVREPLVQVLKIQTALKAIK